MSLVIVGVGMGTAQLLTREAQSAIDEADVLIGATRLLDAVPSRSGTEKFSAVITAEVLALLHRFEGRAVCVLLSGDVGFYSGALALLSAPECQNAQVLPGVSSVQYFAARLRRPWQSWALKSAHGRQCDVVGAVRDHGETFFLTGGELDAAALCGALCAAGFGELTVSVGSSLGSDQERVQVTTVAALAEGESPKLAVLLVDNPTPRTLVSYGLPDEDFIRGQIPMTKSEVRAVVLSKLQLHGDDVLYDIGAGTGSVSVEAALLLKNGQVYAFEREPEGCGLIRENAKKHGVANLTVVEGAAPGSLQGYPPPTVAFIGGSGGAIDGIVDSLLQMNPKLRLVVTAVALETVEEATRLLLGPKFTDGEAVQLSVSRAKRLGTHHLMMAQNPIFIFSGTGTV